MSIHPSDFNWDDDNDSVVAPEQPKIAVYPNKQGAVCVRQEAAWDEDTDTIVIVQPEFVHAVADALIAAGRIAIDVRHEIKTGSYNTEADAVANVATTKPVAKAKAVGDAPLLDLAGGA